MRLLIVEDDSALSDALASALARRGFASDTAAGVGEAAHMLAVAQYAALLLDLGLPDGDGLDLIRRLRGVRSSVPILALTARGGLGDRIDGLNAGADDYIIKPFEIDELVARLNAVLRRQGGASGARIQAGNLTFDTASGETLVGGDPVMLSARERQLLGLLLRRMGNVVSKSLAEDQLYGLNDPVGSNAVEVYLHRLRRKLEAAGCDVPIDTVRGVGYLLRDPKG